VTTGMYLDKPPHLKTARNTITEVGHTIADAGHASTEVSHALAGVLWEHAVAEVKGSSHQTSQDTRL